MLVVTMNIEKDEETLTQNYFLLPFTKANL